jgi:hypothetical protein
MIKRVPLLFPLFAFVFSGCDIIDANLNAERIHGSGRVIQEKRDVSGFNEVRLACVGELSVRQTDKESLSIEAEDNILPKIITEVQGGRLVIRTERGISLSPTVTIRYALTVRDLTALELSGSGKIHAAEIRSNDFSLRLPGSGEIRLDGLTADTLAAEISGSGKIEVPGKVASQRVRISGSGDYDGRNLQSRSADVSVSGSGDSTVWVQEDLTASISGSGKVDYYGNPRVSKHVSGSGGIRSLGDRP